MNYMNYLLLTIFLVLTNDLVKAEEITLFNPDGEAIAYIDADDEDMCIYLWNGRPVAYLEPEDEAFDIYGFNGEHLGWFEEGIVRDHDGYVVGFIKGAINVFTQFEPFKSFKKFKPHRSFQKFAPLKPIYRNQFSSTPLSLFLIRGRD